MNVSGEKKSGIVKVLVRLFAGMAGLFLVTEGLVSTINFLFHRKSHHR